MTRLKSLLQSCCHFGRLFCCSSRTGSCSRAYTVEPPFLELEQRQLSSFDRPPEVGDVILAARHPSTKSIYAGRWDKFVVWCGTLQIYPLLAKQCEVLFFLCLKISKAFLWADLMVICHLLHVFVGALSALFI